jgi:hypothetical protein
MPAAWRRSRTSPRFAADQALLWLDDHAFTSAILDNPSALYAADNYLALTDWKAYTKIDWGTFSYHGIFPGQYVTPGQSMAYAGRPDVNPWVALMFSVVGAQRIGGASDSPMATGGGPGSGWSVRSGKGPGITQLGGAGGPGRSGGGGQGWGVSPNLIKNPNAAHGLTLEQVRAMIPPG